MNNDSPIVQKGDPVLRKNTQEVDPALIGGKTLTREIQAMKDALSKEYDGVAIAAPQIGISRRIFVVSHKVFEKQDSSDDLVVINPVITKKSKKTKLLEEGCLSVRYVYGMVKRHTNVTITYLDENGKEQTRGAGGLLAHIFQHEIDHLDGILFVDKADNTEELKGEDKKEFERRRNKYAQQ